SLDAVVSRGGGLLAGGALSVAVERGGADGGGEGGKGVDASTGKLLSTSAPKSSLTCALGSGSAGLGGAACKDALTATSDVTLNTGRPFAMKLGSKGLARSGPATVARKCLIFQ